MRSALLFALSLAIARAPPTRAVPHPDIRAELAKLRARGIVYDGQIADEYDYVVAGGGLAGLVVAGRLSEDANATVLVLEAGDSGDAVAAQINVPATAYYSGLLGSSYDWQYKTVPQPAAGNRTLPWARGKVLGGSAAVNGMYYVRPSALEVDSWSKLISGNNDSPWTWNAMLAAMKKGETFHAPPADIQAAADIRYTGGAHGTSGPLQISYPGYIVPVVKTWNTVLDNVGVPPNPDSNSGNGWGSFIATSTINPSNWTRSYSRSAYIDPYVGRSNLAVLPNATVTRILWDQGSTSGSLKATQVEFAATRDATRRTVKVRREVILSGGAIGSPHMLLNSGVGPRDVLQAANVPVNVELPGVGQNLQDHISSGVVFKTTADTAASLRASGTNIPNFMSFVNSAVAYVNITDLLGDFAPTFQQQIRDALADSITKVPSQYPQVTEGFKAIYNVNLETLLMSRVGQVELLLSLMGTSAGADTIAIQAALQHPFSTGRLYITTNDPFDYPLIDPQYLSHFADTILMREGLKLARKLGNTEPLKSVMVEEVVPGPSVQSDADWDAFVVSHIGTEYHPSCSCSMLPREQGGVVDAQLKVYGTSNVRVADASVFPIQFAAHLMAPAYGLAEQAADLVRATYNGSPAPNAPQGGSSSTAEPPASTQTQAGAAATNYRASWAVAALAALVAVISA